MRIVIETILHSDQRYKTAGDWIFDPVRDELTIKVSDTGSWDYNALIGVHELVEAILCIERKIPQAEVDAFDMDFEERREEGDLSEPGDDPKAPYHLQHGFASGVERMLCAALRLNWKEYDEAVNGL